MYAAHGATKRQTERAGTSADVAETLSGAVGIGKEGYLKLRLQAIARTRNQSRNRGLSGENRCWMRGNNCRLVPRRDPNSGYMSNA